MTTKQLDRMVEECDTDLRRIHAEIDVVLDQLADLNDKRRNAVRNRDTWLNHPDRKRQKE